MPPALLDVDPDIFASAGARFLAVNEAVCDIVAAAAAVANTGHGMAGADSTGVAWARDYDSAAASLLRAGSAVVDALGVVGDRLVASGANHDAADTASVPHTGGGAGPPAYSGTPGGSRAVGVVVSAPPTANGTPAETPPGWDLVAHLVAYTWPAGNTAALEAVGSGWLTASLKLSDQADRLSGAIADLAGQSSPEVPFALDMCTGLQTTMRTLAAQYATAAQACTGYAGTLGQAHREVIAELIELVVDEAVIEIVGALTSAPTAGTAEIPTQSVAGSRITLAALRIGHFLGELARSVVELRTLVQAVGEHLVDVLASLSKVIAGQETLRAVIALVDAGIPPVDLRANENADPDAHVLKRHVAKSDKYLEDREIPVASTFTSLAAATTAISTVLAANSSVIAQWLRGKKGSLTLPGLLPPGAGRSYLRDSKTFVVPTRLKVVLRRNSNGYFIFTAFPLP